MLITEFIDGIVNSKEIYKSKIDNKLYRKVGILDNKLKNSSNVVYIPFLPYTPEVFTMDNEDFKENFYLYGELKYHNLEIYKYEIDKI